MKRKEHYCGFFNRDIQEEVEKYLNDEVELLSLSEKAINYLKKNNLLKEKDKQTSNVSTSNYSSNIELDDDKEEEDEEDVTDLDYDEQIEKYENGEIDYDDMNEDAKTYYEDVIMDDD